MVPDKMSKENKRPRCSHKSKPKYSSATRYTPSYQKYIDGLIREQELPKLTLPPRKGLDNDFEEKIVGTLSKKRSLIGIEEVKKKKRASDIEDAKRKSLGEKSLGIQINHRASIERIVRKHCPEPDQGISSESSMTNFAEQLVNEYQKENKKITKGPTEKKDDPQTSLTTTRNTKKVASTTRAAISKRNVKGTGKDKHKHRTSNNEDTPLESIIVSKALLPKNTTNLLSNVHSRICGVVKNWEEKGKDDSGRNVNEKFFKDPIFQKEYSKYKIDYANNCRRLKEFIKRMKHHMGNKSTKDLKSKINISETIKNNFMGPENISKLTISNRGMKVRNKKGPFNGRNEKLISENINNLKDNFLNRFNQTKKCLRKTEEYRSPRKEKQKKRKSFKQFHKKAKRKRKTNKKTRKVTKNPNKRRAKKRKMKTKTRKKRKENVTNFNSPAKEAAKGKLKHTILKPCRSLGSVRRQLLEAKLRNFSNSLMSNPRKRIYRIINESELNQRWKKELSEDSDSTAKSVYYVPPNIVTSDDIIKNKLSQNQKLITINFKPKTPVLITTKQKCIRSNKLKKQAELKLNLFVEDDGSDDLKKREKH